jgi:hypothetical protein
MGSLRVWRRKETEGRGLKVEVAFDMEEGVASLAKLVGNKVDLFGVHADGGIKYGAEEGEIVGAEALSGHDSDGLHHERARPVRCLDIMSIDAMMTP